jgi:hypothetical protein
MHSYLHVSGTVYDSDRVHADESIISQDLFEVPADAVAIEREVVLGGRAVDGATVVITR